MPYGAKRFRHGGVTYPLTDSISDELLLVADPALHYAIQLFSTVLETYVEAALLARTAPLGLNLPGAVAHTLHYEPLPFLLAPDLKFPLFCLYRTEELWAENTIGADKSVATWEWVYLLPVLTPHQIRKLNPILRSVAVIVSAFANQSFDPSYEAGATLRDLSGITQMKAGPVRYGNYELVDEQDKWWRSVMGKLFVVERNALISADEEPFEGVDYDIDLTEGGAAATSIESFVEIETAAAPTIARVWPDSGTKAGGATLFVEGTGFKVGSPMKVLIGGAYASSVSVTHPTQLTCLTPEHTAYPTFAADVQVINTDGQASNVLEAAYTFTTP